MSIREVLKTLAEAMVLVFLVVYLFLQSWRAAIIPFAAVPVSLIGTFAGIYLLGYSINTLTLFGMVLAIGIVVDDAIVVLENVERIMREEGLPARDAAIKAMREVTSPIIAIVLTLTAVFVPIAFLGGLTGELYRQFAVTISISVVISGLVALTLSPALCVIMLQQGHHEPNRFFRWFNGWFARVTHRYTDGVVWMIRRAGIVLLVYLAMVGLDRPAVAHDAGQPRARRGPGLLHRRSDPARRRDARAHVQGREPRRGGDPQQSRPTRTSSRSPDFDFIGGGFRNNAATIFVTQKPWDDRAVTAPQLVGELFMKTGGIKEALVLAFNPPPIFGLGTAGGYEFYIQNRGDGGREASAGSLAAVPRPRQRRSGSSVAPQTLWRATVPQLFVDVDREKAKKSGVAIDDVFNALSATLGTYYVNDFNKYGRTWQVLMSAEPVLPDPPRRHRGRLRAVARGRNDSARRRSSTSSTRRGRMRSIASTTCPRSRSSAQARAGVLLGSGDRARRADCAAKRCRRTSASTGAARPIRRRNPAAPRPSRSASPSSWCS